MKIKSFEGILMTNKASIEFIKIHDESKSFKFKQLFDNKDDFFVSKKEIVRIANELKGKAIKFNQVLLINTELKIEFSDKKK